MTKEELKWHCVNWLQNYAGPKDASDGAHFQAIMDEAIKTLDEYHLMREMTIFLEVKSSTFSKIVNNLIRPLPDVQKKMVQYVMMKCNDQ